MLSVYLCPKVITLSGFYCINIIYLSYIEKIINNAKIAPYLVGRSNTRLKVFSTLLTILKIFYVIFHEIEIFLEVKMIRPLTTEHF